MVWVDLFALTPTAYCIPTAYCVPTVYPPTAWVWPFCTKGNSPHHPYLLSPLYEFAYCVLHTYCILHTYCMLHTYCILHTYCVLHTYCILHTSLHPSSHFWVILTQPDIWHLRQNIKLVEKWLNESTVLLDYFAESMQHTACIFDIFNIPWILQNLLFLHTSFWQEGFLNISNPLSDSSFA